jgi:hypothetical protein
MDKNILHFLEFPKSSQLYSSMARNALDILMNIELLFKNKLNLDRAYHEPDNFVIECNNIVRNILFIIEKSKKSKTKYLWLYEFIQKYIDENTVAYSILRKIRNNSLHKELLITDGAIEFGLYRVMNPMEYKLKIGMGDVNKNRMIPSHYIYRETESYFQSLLMFHYYMFMDLDHSAFGECLGITRRWLYGIKNEEEKSTTKIVDIYNTISDMVDSLVNGISYSYSQHSNIAYDKMVIHIESKYNCVNTILEIDLYPGIFEKSWKGRIEPLNWKYMLEMNMIKRTKERHDQMNKAYSFIPNTKKQLIELIDKFVSIKMKDFVDQEEYDKYVTFILIPHYFLKGLMDVDFVKNFDFQLILELHNLGQEFLRNVNRKFDSVDEATKNQYLEKIGNVIQKIKLNLNLLWKQ